MIWWSIVGVDLVRGWYAFDWKAILLYGHFQDDRSDARFLCNSCNNGTIFYLRSTNPFVCDDDGLWAIRRKQLAEEHLNRTLKQTTHRLNKIAWCSDPGRAPAPPSVGCTPGCAPAGCTPDNAYGLICIFWYQTIRCVNSPHITSYENETNGDAHRRNLCTSDVHERYRQ